jgi:CMP-N,N'-diacetyllegionaminic acid synthase
MEILAIIPARGGSKGIPKKNLVALAGKPLVVYSIEQALKTSRITRVVVSTDDKAIARVSQKAGAEVIFRPAKISGDKATSESALLYTLNYLQEKEGYAPDLVVFLQATSPLREHFDIQKAIETLIKDRADSLFSASLFHGFIWRRGKKVLKSFNYDFKNRLRRQEIPEEYLENGSIYIFKPWVLRKFANRLGGRIATYVMPSWKAFQVDEVEDLGICEFYIKRKLATKGVKHVR